MRTSAATQYVGGSGTGNFTQSGGTNAVSGSLFLGNNATGNGIYNSSAGALSASTQYVGYSGRGTFTQSGGTNGPTNLYLGYNSASGGSYSLNSGSLSVKGAAIGYSGKGIFTQTGGTNIVAEDLDLASSPAAAANYSLSGMGTLTATNEHVGYDGTGTFTQSGGTNTITNTLWLGDASTSSGTYNRSGDGTLWSEGEYIGFYGIGTFTQTGGVHTIAGFGGFVSGGSSEGNGTYNLNGGTLKLESLAKGWGTAAFNFGGGTLQPRGPLATALPMTLTGTGGDAQVNTNGYAVTFSGVLSGRGGLNKLGGGTLTLGAAEHLFRRYHHRQRNAHAGRRRRVARQHARLRRIWRYPRLRLAHGRNARRTQGQPIHPGRRRFRRRRPQRRRRRPIDRLWRRSLRQWLAHEARRGHAHSRWHDQLHRLDDDPGWHARVWASMRRSPCFRSPASIFRAGRSC